MHFKTLSAISFHLDQSKILSSGIGLLFFLFQINVVLDDVNDNPPVFARTNVVVISEKISIGSLVIELFTTDQDIGENAISYYTKVPNEGTDVDGEFTHEPCSVKRGIAPQHTNPTFNDPEKVAF